MTTIEDYVYEKKPRSVSQLKQYEKCPMSYRLARIDREWKRPAAWLYQGIAVHAVAQHYLLRRLGYEDTLGYDAELGYADTGPMTREEAYELFKESYADATNEAAEITPNLGWWFRSGMYDGYEDIPRRWDIGLEQVDKLVDWIETHPEEKIWVAPDGKPGIELEIDVELGGVQIRGFIDAVIEEVVDSDPEEYTTELKIRDYKTGNEPGDDFQLAVYAVALKKMYGVEIEFGEYWMAGKKGKKAFATHPFDLTDWPEEKVAARFLELEAKLEAGEFNPLPEPDKCKFCDVSLSCPFSMA
ncbi:RecB family exonuclease [Mycolicibacterium houstonense]|uniref:RecB family exonuclease n=1 Tax=Mycolicibacterium houstonense TaxID=146021 RepID=UPI00082ACFFC|nr:PD-(D/E)XK nuclease family protein [Mycolicibacterium houstonense]